MRTQNIIIKVLLQTKEKLGYLPKHSQANLFPYEIVAIGMLHALKPGSFRAFYRWLQGDYAYLFSGPIPERTRLIRALTTHQKLARVFFASATDELIADAFGMEMVHPWRFERQIRKARYCLEHGKAYRVPNSLAKKGVSNHRWIVGAKLGILLNTNGMITDFDWGPDNVHDSTFNHLALRYPLSDILSDSGFRQLKNQPKNIIICKRGERNDRMLVEGTFSMLTLVTHSKRLWRRKKNHITAQLAYTCAMFNCVTSFTKTGHRSLAEFSL